MAAKILWQFLLPEIAAYSAVPIPRGTRPNQYYIFVSGGTLNNGIWNKTVQFPAGRDANRGQNQYYILVGGGTPNNGKKE